MMSWTKSFTFTETGQPRVQVGLAHARQRSASRLARFGLKPRLTSSKVCARASGSRSGMCCRGIFIRSLFGIVLAIARTSEAVERFLLLLAVHGVALREDAEIDVVRVELRTVDAGELALVADQDAAAAAHPGAVDHDGVEADDGVNVLVARGVG